MIKQSAKNRGGLAENRILLLYKKKEFYVHVYYIVALVSTYNISLSVEWSNKNTTSFTYFKGILCMIHTSMSVITAFSPSWKRIKVCSINIKCNWNGCEN